MSQLSRNVRGPVPQPVEMVVVPEPAVAADIGQLQEPMIAIVTAARVCAHWLRLVDPDLDELRGLVSAMIGRAETTLAAIREAA